MPLAHKSIVFSLLALTLVSCDGDRYDRYNYYLNESEAGKNKALQIVQASPLGEAAAASIPGGSWSVESDFDGNNVFCPGEYTIIFSPTDSSDSESAKYWYVNINNRNVLPAPIDTPDPTDEAAPGSDDDRIQPCMDGKGPVQLDDSEIPHDYYDDR